MNLDDLKDQFEETLNRIKSEIQESPLYNSLRERYDTLPTAAQKGIVAGVLLILFYIVISIPMGYFDEAGYHEEKFNNTRQLLRELLKAGKPDTASREITRDISLDRLKVQVQSALGTFQLVPEQLGPISPGGATEDSLAPKSISEETLRVELKQLNLTQVVRIGHRLQDLLSNVKLTGIELAEDSEKKDYFNTIYILSKFSLPQIGEEEDEDGDKGEDVKKDSGTIKRKRPSQRRTPPRRKNNK